MKKYVLPFCITAAILVCCTHNQTKTSQRHGNDTLKTVGVFLSVDRRRVVDYLYLVAKDTIKIDSALKVTRVRDTAYFTLNNVPVMDSTGRQLLDSLRKPVTRLMYLATPREFVFWHGDRNIDTLLSEKTIPTLK